MEEENLVNLWKRENAKLIKVATVFTADQLNHIKIISERYAKYEQLACIIVFLLVVSCLLCVYILYKWTERFYKK
jgi:hypothetical protein